MSALGSALAVAEFLRKLRGRSQPVLVRANDGLMYVLKFAHNLQGPNLLFNEVMGSELYKAFGLPVPEWRSIQVTDSFLDRNDSCWFQTESGPIRPEAGLCFASRFLTGPRQPVWEILPGSYFGRVSNRGAFGLAWLLDVCAQHSENRQAIFLRTGDSGLRAVFIDHGSMFGGPNACDEPEPLAARYLDPRVYVQELLTGFRRGSDMLKWNSLWGLLKALPADWRSDSALERFAVCISRLADPESVRRAADSIVDLNRSTFICDEAEHLRSDRFDTLVLCTGARRARTRHNALA